MLRHGTGRPSYTVDRCARVAVPGVGFDLLGDRDRGAVVAATIDGSPALFGGGWDHVGGAADLRCALAQPATMARLPGCRHPAAAGWQWDGVSGRARGALKRGRPGHRLHHLGDGSGGLAGGWTASDPALEHRHPDWSGRGGRPGGGSARGVVGLGRTCAAGRGTELGRGFGLEQAPWPGLADPLTMDVHGGADGRGRNRDAGRGDGARRVGRGLVCHRHPSVTAGLDLSGDGGVHAWFWLVCLAATPCQSRLGHQLRLCESPGGDHPGSLAASGADHVPDLGGSGRDRAVGGADRHGASAEVKACRPMDLR